jgi:hypothetical protein
MNNQNPKNLLQMMERTGLALALAATAVSGLVWGMPGLQAAGLGAVLAVVNLYLMRRLLGRALRDAEGGRSDAALKRLMVLVLLKLPVLAALVWVAVRPLKLQPAPFALGLSALIVALLVCGLFSQGLKEAV